LPAETLRTAWLKVLARQQRWTEYLKFYAPQTDTELRCHYHWALYRTGRKDEALRGVERIWLSGKSQPDACDPVFEAWRASGRLTPKLVWQRVNLALEAGRTGLARYLKRYLEPAEAQWVERWIEVHQSPEKALKNPALAADHPRARAIVAYGVRRMARKDPLAAASAWDRIKDRYSFAPAERAAVERRLALALASKDRRESLERLAAIQPNLMDKQTREWRVRAALGQEDWNAAITWIDRLAEDERQEARWQYWRARALDALGQRQEAQELYADLARTRSYYGFL